MRKHTIRKNIHQKTKSEAIKHMKHTISYSEKRSKNYNSIGYTYTLEFDSHELLYPVGPDDVKDRIKETVKRWLIVCFMCLIASLLVF